MLAKPAKFAADMGNVLTAADGAISNAESASVPFWTITFQLLNIGYIF